MEDPDELISKARMLKVGRNIAAARKRKGVNQDYVADVLGIAQPNVARLEGGKRPVRVQELQLIAEALDTSVDELLGETTMAVAEARMKYHARHSTPRGAPLRLIIEFSENELAPDSDLVRKLNEMVRRINSGEF